MKYFIVNTNYLGITMAAYKVINIQHLYLLKWQYREQIEQTKTAEEINAIKFEFTMKDFSKNNE